MNYTERLEGDNKNGNFKKSLIIKNKFKAIHTEIQYSLSETQWFFAGIDKFLLKSKENLKRPQINETILQRKSRVGSNSLSESNISMKLQ